MSFNSYIFILVLLPITVIGYWLINTKYRTRFLGGGKCYLIIISFFFYLYSGVNNVLILFVSVSINWLIAKLIKVELINRKVSLWIGIVINLLPLIYFKYFNFIIENINIFFKQNYSERMIMLPLAISFYTFQQISFLVDIYHDNLKKYNFLDYLFYILYFPKILSGPIVEPLCLIEQINNPKLKNINYTNLAAGIRIFGFGLFKKMIFADTFAKAVTYGMENMNSISSLDMIIVMISFTFEIYFDFSGYSDMAMGISKMLNIELPQNFDSPYKAISIRDFWKRWHMSLTKFLTKNIFIPLGGSKNGRTRTYINTMIVFLISGIWHGANWTYILWGIIHGCLSIFDRIFEKLENKVSTILRWSITFMTINFLWLLFMSENISQWVNAVKKMVFIRELSISNELKDYFVFPERKAIAHMLHITGLLDIDALWFVVFFVGALGLCLLVENNYKNKEKISYFGAILGALAFIWGFLSLGGESTFVYYGF